MLRRFVPARWRPEAVAAVKMEERAEERLSILATEGSAVAEEAAETAVELDVAECGRDGSGGSRGIGVRWGWR